MEFYKTILGRKFFEADFPRLVRALERIAGQTDAEALLKLQRPVIDSAIAYRKENGTAGTDCDIKNRVEEYLEAGGK